MQSADAIKCGQFELKNFALIRIEKFQSITKK
ncbi:MAG: hypothetical protein JWP81_3591 [Ferruginibacter sp.]|nr:hypothetical protein [Ferruginibacter sp.]